MGERGFLLLASQSALSDSLGGYFLGVPRVRVHLEVITSTGAGLGRVDKFDENPQIYGLMDHSDSTVMRKNCIFKY
jgi:hypothetical protein